MAGKAGRRQQAQSGGGPSGPRRSARGTQGPSKALLAIAAVVIAALVGLLIYLFGAPVPANIGNKGPILANLSNEAQGQTIDGIHCDVNPKLVYHIHVHLSMFVDGKPKLLPAGIGIVPPVSVQRDSLGYPHVFSGKCFYWMHTHSESGIIHVESPVKRSFTLGAFFSEWGQSLSRQQLGPFHGNVVVYLNGKRTNINPSDIKMRELLVVTLEVGKPQVPPPGFTWPKGY